jgi:2,4-dienoyl-CoA reductase (NADPH2)
MAHGRGDFAEPVRFLAREIDRLGVAVHLASTVDTDLLDRIDADEIIVATGSRPTTSPTPGATLAHVETATDYLARMPAGASPSVTGPAVVIGASWIGCHAADALAAQGYRSP